VSSQSKVSDEEQKVQQPERAREVVAAEAPRVVLYDAAGRPLARQVGFRKYPERR